MGSKYTEWDAEIVAKYTAGATLAEISEDIHWSRTFVRNRLIDNGVTLRKVGHGSGVRRRPYQKIAEAVRLRTRERLSYKEIAARMGVPMMTVADWLKMAGVSGPLEKTHCANGKHPWIPENIYTYPNGVRRCLPCKRARERERVTRLKEMA